VHWPILGRSLRRQTPFARRYYRVDLRGYVAAMHEAGYAKHIARRLASLRSFFRFGQREGWTKSNPAKPLRIPAKADPCPTFSRPKTSGACSSRLVRQSHGLRDRAILETMYSPACA